MCQIQLGISSTVSTLATTNVPSDEETMLNDICKHRDMRRRQEKHEESWNDFNIQIKQYKEEYHTLK